MSTHDMNELPPLPTPDSDHYDNGTFAPVWKKGKMEAYAHAAIEADRKRKGEVVVTKTPEGEIIAVTRQDDEGRILSVIAEADSKRRGISNECEPVAWVKQDIAENQFINMRPRRIWWECNEGIGMPIFAAPQPAEPVKVPSDAEILDELQSHGALATSNAICAVRALLARYGQPTTRN